MVAGGYEASPCRHNRQIPPPVSVEADLMTLRLAFWRREEEDARSIEQHPKPGLLSDFILGSQDGLVNVLGVILGVAVAAAAQPGTNALRIVLAGGLAAT